MPNAPHQGAGRSLNTEDSPSVSTAPDTRQTLRRARRVLGAALGQRTVCPDLVAAAQLVIDTAGPKPARAPLVVL